MAAWAVRALRFILVLGGMPICPLSGQLPGIALEQRLANRLGARVGDTVSLGVDAGAVDRRAVVSAIYQPVADPAEVSRREYHLRMHLPDLSGTLGSLDRVDRFGVALAPGVSADSAAQDFNRVAFGFRAFPSRAIASESSQTFRVVSRFHQAIAVISVVASAVFLLCIMLLKVEERRRDTAVLRFIGIGRATILSSLLVEAALVSALGSVIGVLLALAASAVTNAYFARYFDTTLIFSLITPGITGFSISLSLVLGIGAGALSAWRLARARPLALWGRG